MKNPETLLMVADSEHSADMLYATACSCPIQDCIIRASAARRRAGHADSAKNLTRFEKVLEI